MTVLAEFEKRSIAWILCITTFFTTIIVMPWFAYDPINTPKLATLTIGGFVGVSVFVGKPSKTYLQKYKGLFLFVGLFLVDLMLVVAKSGAGITQQIFGVFGRSTGFIAYIGLTLLLVSSAVVASRNTFKMLTYSLLLAGLLSTMYGLLQSQHIDFYDWVNQNSPVIGFLGNPNFHSSFLGFCAVMVFSFTLHFLKKVKFAFSLSALNVIILFNIFQTKSQQGIIVFAFGASLLSLIWLYKSSYSKYFPTLACTLAGSGVLVILGMLKIGPMANFVYKPSITYRGDYWRAGWKMTLDHPLFGVGIDNYGDWYRRSRTLEATIRRGPEIVSNAAHNVFLDFSSNGGFPLLMIYILLLILVVHSIFKILRRENSFDPYIFGLISVWFCYLAQTVISINQLGVAVWGWVISGLIIGYEVNSKDVSHSLLPTSKLVHSGYKKQIKAIRFKPKGTISLVGFFIIGLVIGSIPLFGSIRYSASLETRDAQRVEQGAYNWPSEPERYSQVGLILAKNNLQSSALRVLIEGSKKFPDNFEIWSLIFQFKNAEPELLREARSQMKRLDPFNPKLK